MVYIATGDNLERWLAGQPKEVGVVVSARASLREVPNLISLFEIGEEEANKSVIGVFRALALSWLKVAGARREQIDAAAVVVAAVAAAHIASARSDTQAADATLAAARAVDAAGSTDRKFAAAARNTVDAAAGDSQFAWRQISADASALDDGASPRDVANRPLMIELDVDSKFIPPGSSPSNGFLSGWERLRSVLIKQRKDWSVWIYWYERRMHGVTSDPAFENAVLSLAEEDWLLEPQAVNKKLKRLMAEFDFELSGNEGASGAENEGMPTIPIEDPRGARIVTRNDGVIDFAEHPLSKDILHDSKLRGLFEEIKRNGRSLIDSCGNNNAAMALKLRTESFVEALGDSLETLMRPDAQAVFWMRGTRIADELSSQKRALTANDPDVPALPEAMVNDLAMVVNGYQALSQDLPICKDLDATIERRGAFVDMSDMLPAIEDIAGAMRGAKDVFAERVPALLEEMIDGVANDNFEGRSRLDVANRTVKNVIIAIARNIANVSKAVTKKAVEIASAKWLIDNAAKIANYIRDNPPLETLRPILRWIVDLASGGP